MRKLMGINPGFYAFAGFLALLVAGIFAGGFGSTEANGNII